MQELQVMRETVHEVQKDRGACHTLVHTTCICMVSLCLLQTHITVDCTAVSMAHLHSIYNHITWVHT